jgi:hypothetical protein
VYRRLSIERCREVPAAFLIQEPRHMRHAKAHCFHESMGTCAGLLISAPEYVSKRCVGAAKCRLLERPPNPRRKEHLPLVPGSRRKATQHQVCRRSSGAAAAAAEGSPCTQRRLQLYVTTVGGQDATAIRSRMNPGMMRHEREWRVLK